MLLMRGSAIATLKEGFIPDEAQADDLALCYGRSAGV